MADDVAYKLFKDDLTRRPEPSLQFIDGASLLAFGDKFRVLRYPKLPGTWLPRFGGHLRAAMRALRKVHKKGWVHGDIRLHNLVFSEASKRLGDGNEEASAGLGDHHGIRCYAHLIDFDFSREAGESYPVRLSRVTDGQRHPSAKEDSPMLPSHDCFSLNFLLHQFKPRDRSLRDAYRAALETLDADSDSFLKDARVALKPFASVELKIRSEFKTNIGFKDPAAV